MAAQLLNVIVLSTAETGDVVNCNCVEGIVPWTAQIH